MGQAGMRGRARAVLARSVAVLRGDAPGVRGRSESVRRSDFVRRAIGRGVSDANRKGASCDYGSSRERADRTVPGPRRVGCRRGAGRTTPTTSPRAASPPPPAEWPRKHGDVEDLRETAEKSAGLGVGEIVDHYARCSGRSTSPRADRPLLWRLFVELLLDRGGGRAGVAMSPAPQKGGSWR